MEVDPAPPSAAAAAGAAAEGLAKVVASLEARVDAAHAGAAALRHLARQKADLLARASAATAARLEATWPGGAAAPPPRGRRVGLRCLPGRQGWLLTAEVELAAGGAAAEPPPRWCLAATSARCGVAARHQAARRGGQQAWEFSAVLELGEPPPDDEAVALDVHLVPAPTPGPGPLQQQELVAPALLGRVEATREAWLRAQRQPPAPPLAAALLHGAAVALAREGGGEVALPRAVALVQEALGMQPRDDGPEAGGGRAVVLALPSGAAAARLESDVRDGSVAVALRADQRWALEGLLVRLRRAAAAAGLACAECEWTCEALWAGGTLAPPPPAPEVEAADALAAEAEAVAAWVDALAAAQEAAAAGGGDGGGGGALPRELQAAAVGAMARSDAALSALLLSGRAA